MIRIIYVLGLVLMMTGLTIGQCMENAHSTLSDKGWLSCQKSQNPIIEYGQSHWIKYDLGYPYTVDSIYFWNHNVWGETDKGVKDIMVDYSMDGQSWISAGSFTIDQAPGSWKYEGAAGPVLWGVQARYFLFTVLSTWGDGDCAGIGEVKFILGEPSAVETNQVQSWSISPNPAKESIVLSFPDLSVDEIEIINEDGKVIYHLDDPSQSDLAIPVRTFASGIYHVGLSVNGQKQTKSFVKID